MKRLRFTAQKVVTFDKREKETLLLEVSHVGINVHHHHGGVPSRSTTFGTLVAPGSSAAGKKLALNQGDDPIVYALSTDDVVHGGW